MTTTTIEASTPTTCALCPRVAPWEYTVSIFVEGLEVAICGPCHYKLDHVTSFDSMPKVGA